MDVYLNLRVYPLFSFFFQRQQAQFSLRYDVEASFFLGLLLIVVYQYERVFSDVKRREAAPRNVVAKSILPNTTKPKDRIPS